MKIQGLRKRNYSRNLSYIEGVESQVSRSSPVLSEGMINGQGLGHVAQLRYGLCPMSFNGCEVISVCNALRYLGTPRPLWDVALYMERFRVLIGFFGCNVYRIGRALDHFGAGWKRMRREIPTETEAFIVSFWTGRRLMSSVHTVFCVRRPDGGILVYNRYNNCPTVQLCRTVEEIIGRYRPIAAYEVFVK